MPCNTFNSVFRYYSKSCRSLVFRVQLIHVQYNNLICIIETPYLINIFLDNYTVILWDVFNTASQGDPVWNVVMNTELPNQGFVDVNVSLIFVLFLTVDWPISHRAVMRFDDKSSALSPSFQVSHVVAQGIVLSRQNPCTRNIAVFFWVELFHPVYNVCTTIIITVISSRLWLQLESHIGLMMTGSGGTLLGESGSRRERESNTRG